MSIVPITIPAADGQDGSTVFRYAWSRLTVASVKARNGREPRREAILQAACRVIGQVGVDRLRMSDVAAEAGVSTALVHYYFATRAELLTGAFLYADERAAEIEVRISDAYPPVERIERMLLVYLIDESDIYENWVLWREMVNHAIFAPELRPVWERAYVGWVEELSQIVREGQADGSIDPQTDPEAAIWRLTALVDGLGPALLLGALDRRRTTELIRDAVERELGVRARH